MKSQMFVALAFAVASIACGDDAASAVATPTVIGPGVAPDPVPTQPPPPPVVPHADPSCPTTGPSDQHLIQFSGHTWRVKGGPSQMGPGPNYWDWSSEAVFVDCHGRLNLMVRQTADGWKSAEVWLPGSLGYGTYVFVIDSDVATLDPQLNASPFIYQDDAHEFDIEYSRWADPLGHNAQFVVQPGTYIENRRQMFLDGPLVSTTSIIDWRPDQVTFRIEQGGKTLASWSYAGPYNFVPGKEHVELNHWMFHGKPPIDGKSSTMIIKSFSFTP